MDCEICHNRPVFRIQEVEKASGPPVWLDLCVYCLLYFCAPLAVALP